LLNGRQFATAYPQDSISFVFHQNPYTSYCMNDVSNGLHRNPADILFFALCFLGLLTTIAGVITFTVWAAALGILIIAVGLGYFAICQFI
jgi:hypothetical protein